MAAGAPDPEQVVRARHNAGHSQRAIARDLRIDRRKVKRIIDQAAWADGTDSHDHATNLPAPCARETAHPLISNSPPER
jgi:DNA invertase Pin-like site-specific DNA recombinase